ncbi:hypothetical protein [Herminiimonas sp. CN]|uniref:hypothetical protein n=1 Tax=Herminiimonas sp. CN TaxID=1349818 RepID=UPI00055228BD|nr:hypothetical protein [Herminiimonas sp. CN]
MNSSTIKKYGTQYAFNEKPLDEQGLLWIGAESPVITLQIQASTGAWRHFVRTCFKLERAGGCHLDTDSALHYLPNKRIMRF